MKKITKLLVTGLLLIVLSFSLLSCQGKDKYKEYAGVYAVSEYLYYTYNNTTGAALVPKTAAELAATDEWIELKADGTFLYHENEEDFIGGETHVVNDSGTYTVSVNDGVTELTLEQSHDGMVTVYKYTYSNNTLVYTVYAELGVNGVQTKVTYTKK
ncbi:MAG: lactonase family protein [Acholeplasmatales bacterium]|jgi:hypothetical protein|nr:lactonase family protein [Acholeplasmatales bacterium]